MRKQTTQFCASLLPLVVGALLAIPQSPSTDVKHTTDIAVVVNADNPVNDVKLSELRKIVVGEQRTWTSRFPIELILRQDGAQEQVVLLHALAQTDASQFHKLWAARVFRGEVSAEPVIVPSSGLATEFVATHRGAVAFVRGTDVRRDLKVLKIDGLLPGMSGYPLR